MSTIYFEKAVHTTVNVEAAGAIPEILVQGALESVQVESEFFEGAGCNPDGPGLTGIVQHIGVKYTEIRLRFRGPVEFLAPPPEKPRRRRASK